MPGGPRLDLRCSVPDRGKSYGRPKTAPRQSYSPSTLSARLVAFLTGTSAAAEQAMRELGWLLFPASVPPNVRAGRALARYLLAYEEAAGNMVRALRPFVEAAAQVHDGFLSAVAHDQATRRRRMQDSARASGLSPLGALRAQQQLERAMRRPRLTLRQLDQIPPDES